MRHAPVVCLIAATGLSACAPESAELDALYEDLAAALAAGDHDHARRMGEDFLGSDAHSGEAFLAEPDGYLAGNFYPGGDGSLALGGFLVTLDPDAEHWLEGHWIVPGEGRMRGEVYAVGSASDTSTEGSLGADFLPVFGVDAGTIRGDWSRDGTTDELLLSGDWTGDFHSQGSIFGLLHHRTVPDWGDGVRLRIEVDGTSKVLVSPDGLALHHVAGAAPGQAGVGLPDEDAEPRATMVNGEPWTPLWPEEGENQDCDCVTELLRAPEGAMAPEATEVELSILRGRGLVHVTLAPAVDNRHTTVISINDSAYEGPGWYEIELGYPEE